MRVQLPSLASAFVDTGGLIRQPWNFFLQALTAPPAAIQAATVGTSPFSYTAPNDGQISIVGGTVTGVSITRGKTTLAVGTPSLIGVSQGDIVGITYTVEPVVNYIPD